VCPPATLQTCFVINWADADDGELGYVSSCNTSGQAVTGLLVISIILLLIGLVLAGLLVVKRDQSLGDDLNYTKFLIPIMALVVIFTIAANANWRTNCHNKIGPFYQALEVDYDIRLSRSVSTCSVLVCACLCMLSLVTVLLLSDKWLSVLFFVFLFFVFCFLFFVFCFLFFVI
jgi:hypothetical protein